jgi:hypothetical protein
VMMKACQAAIMLALYSTIHLAKLSLVVVFVVVVVLRIQMKISLAMASTSGSYFQRSSGLKKPVTFSGTCIYYARFRYKFSSRTRFRVLEISNGNFRSPFFEPFEQEYLFITPLLGLLL